MLMVSGRKVNSLPHHILGMPGYCISYRAARRPQRSLALRTMVNKSSMRSTNQLWLAGLAGASWRSETQLLGRVLGPALFRQRGREVAGRRYTASN